MGLAMSKKQPSGGGKVIGKASGATQAPAPAPTGPPYNGHPIYYHHIIINASLAMQAQLGLFSVQNLNVQSTNVEQYYPQLAAMYAQGFKMLLFVSLPGSSKVGGFGSINTQSTIKFQAIFRKLLPEEIDQGWELKVEKSMLINQMFVNWNGNLFLRSNQQSGSTTDSSPIIQTLQNVTANGGRLISVEVTGMAGQQMAITQQMMEQQTRRQFMMTGTMPTMQVPVDVFYEVPSGGSSERYVYQVVGCPMNSTFQTGIPGRWSSVIDWQGVMTQYLGTGWKLVEIFEDFSAMSSTQMQGLSANVTQMKNCLWIFEKPVSRINDNTPYYEGTMVEHWFTSSTQIHGMGFGGAETNVTTDWEPVIDQFGRQGWQVVRILSTPDTQMQGMFNPTIHTRQMIFFQRLREGMVDVPGYSSPIVPTNPNPIGFDTSGQPAAPPAYNELYDTK